MPQAQQLGRYQLLDRLAFGGMAEIFRAKTFDSQGNVHLVAVKKVLQHLITDEEFIKMLVDEAKVSALLRHDNIARVYEFAHFNDEYFLSEEVDFIQPDSIDRYYLYFKHHRRPLMNIAELTGHFSRGIEQNLVVFRRDASVVAQPAQVPGTKAPVVR